MLALFAPHGAATAAEPTPVDAAAPQGWQSREAHDRFATADAAAASRLYDKCIENDLASLKLEERLTTRVHLAGCEERAGKIVAALRDVQRVLEAGIEARDADITDAAQKRVEQLLRRLARVRWVAPGDATGLRVTLDDAEVPADKLAEARPIDPGKHRAHAEATVEGRPMVFDAVVDAPEGGAVTVEITLRPRASEYLTPGQIACMVAAANQDEVLKCFLVKEKPLVARVETEVAAYADTLSVRILSPSIHGLLWSPTSGWNVGARYVIDVVSAASPDFVSTASRRGHDTRQAASANAGYKPGRFGIDASGAYSTEADYVSRSGAVAVTADLADKRVTPRLGYSHTVDTIGRGGTPFSFFSNTLISNEANAGVTFVLSPTTILVAGGSATFERGDPSKPYRLIPMFAPGTSVAAGASTDEVNAKRLPVRPYEQLPRERDRYAIAARLAHRGGSATLRLEERLYRDSWDIQSSSTDLRYIIDLGEALAVWPHLHAHVQSGADFYHRVYYASTAPALAVPVFRTTDRELTPLVSGTAGLGARWALAHTASTAFALVLSGDAMYTRYLDSLYIDDRLAIYGTFGVEAQIE